jgi:hypothetical protein
MRSGTGGLAEFDCTIAVDSLQRPFQNHGVTVPPIPSDARRFRMAIVPMVLFIFLAGFIFGYGLGFGIAMAKVKAQVSWAILFKSAPFIIPFLLIYAVAFAFVISLFYPCSITSAGVYGHSFLGLRRFLGWSDISAAKKVSLGNLVFLRLRSNTDGTTIWLPLFQSDRVEFLETVRKCAPPGHPVLSHLG